jgi:hypothetical protein
VRVFVDSVIITTTIFFFLFFFLFFLSRLPASHQRWVRVASTVSAGVTASTAPMRCRLVIRPVA